MICRTSSTMMAYPKMAAHARVSGRGGIVRFPFFIFDVCWILKEIRDRMKESWLLA